MHTQAVLREIDEKLTETNYWQDRRTQTDRQTSHVSTIPLKPIWAEEQQALISRLKVIDALA
jgi:hypothetical protein